MIEKPEKHPEWLFGLNPDAILAQEKEGQNQLAEASQLPVFGPTQKDSKAEIESLGVKVIGKSQSDELFYDVQLPDGWKIVPTEHSMWSILVDEKGAKKAGIFYKAAFYDRHAFIRLKEG